ncbi:hypothetical protein [Streptomyces tropicalis]|uniref:Uncharacterized protein n=1 Tax=Streptomyces tropicalis TaxID=3034234 RepID=A0ABT6AA56_9ACTN|nr:hypothetical protein [Streptomyces tropicalis]MDF3301525.1 hypothetical protein [Streptomyces tropicalis]
MRRRTLRRATPQSPREAAAGRARHLRAQLGVAADIAIRAQRRALAARRATGDTGPRGRPPRGRVTVADVLEYARQHFGLVSVERGRAAAALRARYELRGGRRDLDTDAYGD